MTIGSESAPVRGPATASTGTTWSVAIALSVALFLYWIRLWPEWSQNADLAHGFLSPVIVGLLLWESRRHGFLRWLKPAPWRDWSVGLAVGAGFVLFALAGLLAASVAWTHALVLCVLGLSLACFLFAGLLILADESVRFLPFNWTSLTAIILCLLVAPLPNGTYMRLTLALQRMVTGAVFETVHLLGIPARQHGNLIELATTTVGVEEACSGIRSLLACVFAGFFLAAWRLRRPRNRLILLLAAPMLALVMNFLRSLLLTLLANAGRDIKGGWHDATGYAILAATALLLAWLAGGLEKDSIGSGPRSSSAASATGSTVWALRFFWTGLIMTVALGTFYLSQMRPADDTGKPIPDLAVLLPLQVDGWEVTSATNLYRFTNVLETTHLLQRTYARRLPNGEPLRVTIYIAYWPAGQTTVSRVASHTPDACWPGSGWSATASSEPHQALAHSGKLSYPAEYRMFRNSGGVAEHVWFWHIYDGRPIDYRDPYSVSALLVLAVDYGFRHQGDQCFVRFSSNQPWTRLAGEPLVAELLDHLSQLGL